MANTLRNLRKFRKIVDRNIYNPEIKVSIPAAVANAGHPMSMELGQKSINISLFCKDFNQRTKDMKNGVPLPTRISVNPDRSYHLEINKPHEEFYIAQAAGCEHFAFFKGDHAGKITLKHVYEIAQIKSTDFPYQHVPLQKLCQKIIYLAFELGIEVVDKIDEAEYSEFLSERKVFVAQKLREIEEQKTSKK